ncbi:MAG: hypothetical protein PHU73_04950, partial [Patescibacteria group bacterium]|nr:hypothetical protein [Patescibacteria group bacterium]
GSVQIKFTSAEHDGYFGDNYGGGYKAMNDWIHQNGCDSTYHVCNSVEINAILQKGYSSVIRSWFHSVFGLNSGTHPADCNGWASNDYRLYGSAVECRFVSMVNDYRCSVLPPDCSQKLVVACCK